MNFFNIGNLSLKGKTRDMKLDEISKEISKNLLSTVLDNQKLYPGEISHIFFKLREDLSKGLEERLKKTQVKKDNFVKEINIEIDEIFSVLEILKK